MEIDESFKQPGAIPFKWEIRPGVPKAQQQSNEHIPQKQASSDHFFSLFPQQQQPKQQKQPQSNEEFSFPDKRQTLAPPPAGLYFQALMNARTDSFRSAPRTHSERYRFNSSTLAHPASVSSRGCFPSPNLLNKRNDNSRTKKPKPKYENETESDPNSSPILGTLSRRSVSTRKSLSSFRDSPLSSSSSSYKSSPKPDDDAEWAGFGLF